MKGIETTEKANYLVGYFSNRWLCNKLSLSAPTLRKRLGNNDWKLAECAVIEDLYDRITSLESSITA